MSRNAVANHIPCAARLPERLKRARILQGFRNVPQAALGLPISVRALYEYESTGDENRVPSALVLGLLARHYQTRADWLLGLSRTRRA